jgi:uroporphyrinogen-III synthase
MITSSSVLATWPPDWMPPRIPLYVIGDASAQMALGLGFFDVRPAHEPHQSALIETIKSDFPQGGIVMWLRGKQVAQELEPEVVAPLLLRQYIHYEIVWDLQRILEMPDHLDLEEQTLCVLGSPTLARTLIERLPRNLRDLIHWVALGKSTFRCLANENKVHVLDAPTPEALAHCLLSIRLEKI